MEKRSFFFSLESKKNDCIQKTSENQFANYFSYGCHFITPNHYSLTSSAFRFACDVGHEESTLLL